MFTSTRSRPAVGPWKYPWSIASMSVRPEAGLKMRARRFCTPQSSEFAPFRKKASCLTGTSRWKFLVSFTSSTSGTVGLLCCGGRSWPSGRRTIAGKVRARQLEQPRDGPRLAALHPRPRFSVTSRLESVGMGTVRWICLDTDDLMHENTGESNYNESAYYNFYDPAQRLGGFVRIGNRPNEGYAEMTLCLYLPDGTVGFMFGRPRIAGNAAFDAGGIRFEVRTPMREHVIRYDGTACRLERPL